MKENLKAQFEAILEENEYFSVNGLLAPECLSLMQRAYELALQENIAEVNRLQKEINRAGNIAMDLRGKILKFHWEDDIISEANQVVNILSQIASDQKPLPQPPVTL